MSEQNPDGTGDLGQQNPPGTPNPDDLGTGSGTGQQSGETDYKAEAERLREELKKARKFEDQVKALRPKAQKFDELQQATMSAEERAQAAVEAATQRENEAKTMAETAQRELAILRAGVEHKLDKEDLVFLEGVPTDKIEESAKLLAKRLGKADTPDFDRGPRSSPPARDNMTDFIRDQIAAQTGRGRRR
jgi:hypothetical protein